MFSSKVLGAVLALCIIAIGGLLVFSKKEDPLPPRKIAKLQSSSTDRPVLSAKEDKNLKKTQQGLLETLSTKGKTTQGVVWSYKKEQINTTSINLTNADGTLASKIRTDPVATSLGGRFAFKADNISFSKVQEALKEITLDPKLEIKEIGIGNNKALVISSKNIVAGVVNIKQNKAIVENVYNREICKLLKVKQSEAKNNEALKSACELSAF